MGANTFVISFSFFLHQAGPVTVSLCQIAFGVLIKIVPDAFAVLEQQSTVHDLKGFYINLYQFVSRYAICAKTTEGRLVFRWVGFKQIAMLSRGEVIEGPIVADLEFRLTLDGLALGKKPDWVVALKANATFVEVQQRLVLRQEGQGQYCNGGNYQEPFHHRVSRT